MYCVIRSALSTGLAELRDAHKRFPIGIIDPHAKTVDALMRIDLPAGVDVSIR